MNNKNFLKLSNINQERYFKTTFEFISFIEKMNGMSWETMCDIYSSLSNNESKKNYFKRHLNVDGEILVIGNFIVRIFRGYFVRTSGDYKINILTIAKTNNLTNKEIVEIINKY